MRGSQSARRKESERQVGRGVGRGLGGKGKGKRYDNRLGDCRHRSSNPPSIQFLALTRALPTQQGTHSAPSSCAFGQPLEVRVPSCSCFPQPARSLRLPRTLGGRQDPGVLFLNGITSLHGVVIGEGAAIPSRSPTWNGWRTSGIQVGRSGGASPTHSCSRFPDRFPSFCSML